MKRYPHVGQRSARRNHDAITLRPPHRGQRSRSARQSIHGGRGVGGDVVGSTLLSSIRYNGIVDLRFSAEDEAFRAEIRSWLDDNLRDFEDLRGRGGPGDDDVDFEGRLNWERRLAAGGWTCVGWPKEHGGRGATLNQ